MESSLNLTMRHWKSMDDFRYCVSAKKTYRLFFAISAIIFLIMAICCVVLSVGKCKTFYNYIAVILAAAFFIFCGCMGICSAAKRAEVYKGRILYYNVFRKKEYRLSDIRGSRTKEESYKVYSGNGIPASGWDVVTTFYDASGKKVFRFGLAYNNVERLKKDIENIQKSIARNWKSSKGC